jgi:hypothetical protein
MNRHRLSALVFVCVLLLVATEVGRVHAQLLTADAPQKRAVNTFQTLATLTNLQQATVTIPDDQDLIVTDVVATCRTLNACAMNLFGPFQNASFDLMYLDVPANSTVSHAFSTGLRVPGGSGGQLFIHNLVQPGPNALLSVTVTVYFVRK